MKPNGKYFVVRVVFVTLFALGAFTSVASAEGLRGTFKLTTEARWGQLLLAPGEYEFTMSQDGSGSMVTVRSKETGWSGLVVAEAISDTSTIKDTQLVLTKVGDGLYVSQLCLGDAGIALDYAMSKSAKFTRLAKAPETSRTLASASGGQ